ncbi:MAG: metal-dependent phosphohydrolase [Desulfobulbus propionicus]|nr:MAG: metal-dependent phosphohydrolase [Desulfobulbus propionicus]PIE63922.1 MAG: metal-dependent phosphohydrolase [Desulfobacterales bacterium]
MNIPSIAQCAALMQRYGMWENIRHHSLVVARLADQIVSALARNRNALPVASRKLVVAGALLHDIAKTQCIEQGGDHARLGAEICRKHGYPEIAEIVAEHVILQQFDPKRYVHGHFTAKEIVYYADKRVRHHEIVHLDQRLQYILERYGQGDPRREEFITKNFNICVELEGYLFKWLDFPPQDLGRTK